jgi:hypothetical protein
VKVVYAAGFDVLVNRWDNCIIVGGEYVKKSYMFYVLYPFLTYIPTPAHKFDVQENYKE